MPNVLALRNWVLLVLPVLLHSLGVPTLSKSSQDSLNFWFASPENLSKLLPPFLPWSNVRLFLNSLAPFSDLSCSLFLSSDTLKITAIRFRSESRYFGSYAAAVNVLCTAKCRNAGTILWASYRAQLICPTYALKDLLVQSEEEERAWIFRPWATLGVVADPL